MGSPASIFGDASWTPVSILPVSMSTGEIDGLSGTAASNALSSSGAGASAASSGCSKGRAEDGLHKKTTMGFVPYNNEPTIYK
jgi:hypothetical protein